MNSARLDIRALGMNASLGVWFVVFPIAPSYEGAIRMHKPCPWATSKRKEKIKGRNAGLDCWEARMPQLRASVPLDQI